MGPIIVLALRLVVPVAIFRWPLAGGIAAMLLDGADVILIDLIGGSSLPGLYAYYDQHYHTLDKYLDTYYLFFEFLVSLRWQEQLARTASIALFVWRAAGVVVFELTGLRVVLFIAPNLFENFYLFYLAIRRFLPGWELKSLARLGVALAILYVPKFGQEYLLHIQQATPWLWFSRTLLGW